MCLKLNNEMMTAQHLHFDLLESLSLMPSSLLISSYLGYTTLHDRNENSTPPSTQMSYLQMNSLRNGSGGNTTASNQTSIYPMLKEENSSNSGNNSSNYPSLSELSVSFFIFNFIKQFY
jgi:hypothetical protein